MLQDSPMGYMLSSKFRDYAHATLGQGCKSHGLIFDTTYMPSHSSIYRYHSPLLFDPSKSYNIPALAVYLIYYVSSQPLLARPLWGNLPSVLIIDATFLRPIRPLPRPFLPKLRHLALRYETPASS